MQKYTNTQNLDLLMQVFLASDTYDYEDNVISATRLIKPTRQLILGGRVDTANSVIDVSANFKSSIGTAIHDGVENSWLTSYTTAMTELGYPQSVIDRIVLNPTDKQLEEKEDIIPIYFERRWYKELNGYKISGKTDVIADGIVKDIKSTTTYTYTHNTKYRDYQLQGSIYRWLAPHVITADHITIQYIFLDWAAYKIHAEANYPPSPMHTVQIPLLSLEETEAYINQKLNELATYRDADEIDIPPCTKEELWQTESTFKYYKNPAKTQGRSTKNFDTAGEAYARLSADGNVGVVIEKPGEIKACLYCSGYTECSQKDEYIANGSLKLH